MSKLYTKTFNVNNMEEVNKEFTKLETTFAKLDEHLVTSTTTSAPKRFSEFTIVHADGVGWNPGQGEGVYIYLGGRWRKFTLT